MLGLRDVLNQGWSYLEIVVEEGLADAAVAVGFRWLCDELNSVRLTSSSF